MEYIYSNQEHTMPVHMPGWYFKNYCRQLIELFVVSFLLVAVFLTFCHHYTLVEYEKIKVDLRLQASKKCKHT
jgi:hypothetical protein